MRPSSAHEIAGDARRGLVIAALALGSADTPARCADALTDLLDVDAVAWAELTGALACDVPLGDARTAALEAAAPGAARAVERACVALAADAELLLAGPRTVVAVDAASSPVEPAVLSDAFGGVLSDDGRVAVVAVPTLLAGADTQVVCADPGEVLTGRLELTAALWEHAVDGAYADVATAWDGAGALLGDVR